MEEKLKDYMENLFRDVPDTEQAREIKEEILQNITDKYHDLLAEGKTEEAAYNIAIEGIGDLSELLDSLKENGSGSSSASKENSENKMYSANQAEYMEWKKKSAVRTAIAVMLYILCVVPPIICESIQVNENLGAVFLFVFIAAATGILIFNNMTKPSFTKNGDTMADEFMEWKHKNDVNKQTRRSVRQALWSLIVVLYFVISFTTGAWHMTWLIFPLGAAVQSILNACMHSENSAGLRAVQIICSVFVSIAVIGLIVFIAFRIFKGDFSFNMMGGTHYANAEKYTAGDVTIQPDSGNGNALSEIRVNWIDGSVELQSVEGLKNIEIAEEKSSDMPEGDRVHSYYHDGILEIQYRESGNYFFQSHTTDKHLQIKIPAELAKEIESIDGDFVSSEVTIGEFDTDQLIVDTVSGNLNFTGSVEREIDVDVVSGNSTYRLKDAPSSISTDSVSGDVTLILPQTASFEAEFDTVSGEMSCGLSAVSAKNDGKDSKYIRCGDGSNEFEFDSVSGNVEIQAAG